MRPKNTSAVRRGLASLIARSGTPSGRDELRAAEYVRQMAGVTKLRPNNPSGPAPKRKRKR